MVANARLLLLLLVAGLCAGQQERSISSGPRRRNRLPAGKSEVLDFSCPEDFGYYQHPTDCTQYYVCVFGGALQESCSGGLVYSHDLQTCDWPRNVVCNVDLSAPVSTVRVTDPRTAAPPPSSRSNLTPSVSSNGFAETLRSSGGRKEQLSGPSSSSVNRQGRIISGSSDRAEQDIRGRFQLQESTNRAFTVSPTTTSRTFSFPDGQKRQKRATPDQLDDVTEIGVKSRIGRARHDDSVSGSARYPRIVRRGYDTFPKNLADDDENFVNFKRPDIRSHNFKFFPFDDASPDSPKKTHDFFSLDSIEEDLDRGQSLLVDMKVQRGSNIQYQRPMSAGQSKRPPDNKNSKRAVGPSALSYNAVKTPPLFHFQEHIPATPSGAFRSQSLEQQSSSPFSKIGNKLNVAGTSPSFSKFIRGAEETYGIRPASGFSSSSSANPFSKFTMNENHNRQPIGVPIRVRPKPTPYEIDPFHEYRPVHEYTFGPPNHQKDLKDLKETEEPFSPGLHNRDSPDLPRHHQQFTIAEGHTDQNGKREHVTEHTPTRSTKLSQPQPSKQDSNNDNRYFEKTKSTGFLSTVHSPRLHASDPLPTRASQEFRRPVPTVSNQQQQNIPISGNDYTLPHNSPEKQPFAGSSDDFLHPTPGTRYHEELDYPLLLDNYEYADEYFYGEPPPPQSYELSNPNRPDGNNHQFFNWYREPENLGIEEQKNFSTSRPQFHSAVSSERHPTFPTKFIRNRPPIHRRPSDSRPLNLQASEELEFPYRPTATEIPTTERPTRPTRPKIHIPVRRHRKTTSTTTFPPPPEQPQTTLKPFTFPTFEKASPFRGDLRNSVSSKQPIHIPGTARHPELSKLPATSATNKQQTTDGRQSLKQNSRPVVPGAETVAPFKNQFDSRPQSSSSFSSSQNQQSPVATPAPSALDDNFYSDLLNLTDAEYFYLYEDLLLEDYFDGTAGSTTPKPTTRTPLRQSSSSSQKTSPGSSAVKVDNSRPSRLTLQPVSQIVKNNIQQVTNIWKYPARRPAPLYPQPPVNTLATKCDRKSCRLPDCSCGGKEVPGGIAPQDVPQMVLLTFDDSVNDLNKELYQDLFERGRTNPNGCPLAATFYISHEWTDYSQVQNLYADGHEIASHSITHSFGEQFSKLKWAKEIAGQREIMAAYGGVLMEDVRGMRAPFLAVGGNKMFEMLYEQNFTYDSSMPVYENRPPSYPYTLDYKLFHDCMIPPCPTNSFPGLWEVPMVMWQDLNGGRCSMGDACTTPPDAEGVYKMLIKNFERHYTTNRAPMGLFYHAAWFTTAHHKEGFIAFLDTISGMPDVWLVTNWQALQWMRDPVPISQAQNFKPFQCNYPERPPRCKTHRVCNVWHKGGVRYMRTCQKCPEAYPWVGNTGVASPLNDV